MKKALILIPLLSVAGCASTGNYPAEGNVAAKDYQHVSGVKERRSAAAETATLIGTATVSATAAVAAGGTPVAGNPDMRRYTVTLPNTSKTYDLPEGCQLLDGSTP